MTIFHYLNDPAFSISLWLFLLALIASGVFFFLWLKSFIELARTKEKLDSFQTSQQKMQETFKSLSSEALRHNSEFFLQLAFSKLNTLQSQAGNDLQRRKEQFEGLVKPIKESLEKMDSKLHELDKQRHTADARLSEQIIRLQHEASSLSKALRQPHVRGRWGEVQLKRVVEMAGMLEHCDFSVQVSTKGEEKRRPDMIVRLPGGKNVVVDAKTPLHAYLEAHETIDDHERLAKMKDHARQVRHHIDELSKKSYWDQFQPAPEFVILFLPGEPFYSAALEHDPSLIEWGVEQKVILATPTTLIAILRSIAYGWRQEVIEKNCRQISDAGKVLYERLAVFSEHLTGVKKGLDAAVKSYNQAIGSYESRVVVAARKLHELGGAAMEEEELTCGTVDTLCRNLSALETSNSHTVHD